MSLLADTTTDIPETQQSETTVPDAAPTTTVAAPGAAAHTDSAAAFVPDQSRAERTASFDVAAFPIPSGREEDWRFTPVKKLAGLLRARARIRSRRGAAARVWFAITSTFVSPSAAASAATT